MKMKQLLKCGLVAALAVVSFNAQAANVDANTAKATANKFIKQKYAQQGKMMAPATADFMLAYTEASSVSGNAYYVFNITGGRGWVIVAGDDLAKQVLAYGDKGNIDMNNLPGSMKDYLNLYKNQIQEMQSYKGQVIPIKTAKRSTVVEPILKSTWGQGNPFNRRIPMVSGEHASVGCGPLAMAQIMYYWKYPNECSGVEQYYIYNSSVGTMPALPATTFKFDQMLDTYTIYYPEQNAYSTGTFTDEQADAVAELCLYCGQACKTRYGSSSGSGSYSYDQRNAFKTMGYNSELKLIGIWPSYYCDNSNRFTDEEWINLIHEELEEGHPIPYHNVDFIDGHAWVLDGVDADGKFHMNWGWNEVYNGWFEYGAFTVYPNGETWNFNGSSNEMVVDVFPYEGYVIPGDDPQPTVERGDVNGIGGVDMDDLTALINYLLDDSYTINTANAAACNNETDTTVDMDDLTALINFLLTEQW